MADNAVKKNKYKLKGVLRLGSDKKGNARKTFKKGDVIEVVAGSKAESDFKQKGLI